MPEQITKYPDVTIQALKGGGARCGPGVQKQILTQCPSEQFCAFPSGEVCIYGISQIPQMTQVQPQELAPVVCPPIELPMRRPTNEEIMESEEGQRRLAGFMLRRYADRVSATHRSGRSTVLFHFDH